jgi:hypothetical protein
VPRPSTGFAQTFGVWIALVVIATHGCQGKQLVPEKLPGTERLWGVGDLWLTISPDESFAAFVEVDSAYPPPPFRWEHPPTLHMVTLDLKTGMKTHHHLDDLPPGTLPSKRPLTYLLPESGEGGWSDGSLLIEYWHSPVPTLNPWVAFTPGVPAAKRVSPPDSVRCSDCPPPGAVRKIADSREIEGVRRIFLPELFSVAYKNGRLSEHLYTDLLDGDGVEFIRSDSKGRTKIVTRVKRFGRQVVASEIRVSPNERYLGYAIRVRFKVPIPTGGVEEMYVFDLKKRRTYRIKGIYTAVSNLIWSPDSRRLYFGARDIDTNGLYRVTLPD